MSPAALPNADDGIDGAEEDDGIDGAEPPPGIIGICDTPAEVADVGGARSLV